MLEIIIIFFCLVLNGVLACAEIAFVSVSKPALRVLVKQGNNKAKRLLQFREKPERILSVIQVGITFLAFLAAAFGGSGATKNIAPHISSAFHVNMTIAIVISNLLIVIPLTYLNVVFSELVPKVLALRRTMYFALATVRWLDFIQKIISPVITVLEWSTRKAADLFFRIVKIQKKGEEGEGEVVEIGGLTSSSKQYIFNIVSLEQKTLKQIVIPWENAVIAYDNQSEEDVENIAISSGHTRLPVLRDEKVIGILHTKEFFAFQKTKKDMQQTWTVLIRPALKFKEDTFLLTAFRKMQMEQSHMAIVYENETKIGFITLEDILEQVVGEIYDEDDDREVMRFLRSQRK
ncbi:MAG: hemolysin family protein [Simkaniaceae bacterium]